MVHEVNSLMLIRGSKPRDLYAIIQDSKALRNTHPDEGEQQGLGGATA